MGPGERVNGESFGFNVPQPSLVEVAGFDRFQTLSLWPRASVSITGDSLVLVADSSGSSIAVTRGKDTLATLDESHGVCVVAGEVMAAAASLARSAR